MPSPWTNRLLTSLLDEADQAARIITYRNLELRMTTQEERDRAVIARRKAGEKRHIAAIAGTTEWVHDKPNLNDGRLPEAAFDWPIYAAALREEAELLNAYGRAKFGDEWWPSNAKEWIGPELSAHDVVRFDALSYDQDLSESELRAMSGDR